MTSLEGSSGSGSSTLLAVLLEARKTGRPNYLLERTWPGRAANS